MGLHHWVLCAAGAEFEIGLRALERAERETDKNANARSADNHCSEYSAPKKGRENQGTFLPRANPLVFNLMMFNSGDDPATVAGWDRASLASLLTTVTQLKPSRIQV